MRHAMANRRRNRPNGGGGHQSHQNNHHRPQQNKATVFDSNGPDVRIRGTAFQIVEKYMTLAKDAAASGDRVLAENYLQHAEHYQRMISQWVEENPAPRVYNDQPAVDASAEQPDVVVTRPSQAATPAVEDDLGLPASILGGKAKTDDDAVGNRMAVAG